VRPYYLYQCDLVEAPVTSAPGRQGRRDHGRPARHTSGYACTSTSSTPRRRRQDPVAPNYLLSMSDHKIILRNYEGYVTTYEEPVDYLPSQAAQYKGEKRLSRGRRVSPPCWTASRCSSSRRASTSCTTGTASSTSERRQKMATAGIGEAKA